MSIQIHSNVSFLQLTATFAFKSNRRLLLSLTSGFAFKSPTYASLVDYRVFVSSQLRSIWGHCSQYHSLTHPRHMPLDLVTKERKSILSLHSLSFNIIHIFVKVLQRPYFLIAPAPTRYSTLTKLIPDWLMQEKFLRQNNLLTSSQGSFRLIHM
jgi:hypothetical protein